MCLPARQSADSSSFSFFLHSFDSTLPLNSVYERVRVSTPHARRTDTEIKIEETNEAILSLR